MSGERLLCSDEGFQIILAVIAAGAASRGPFRICAWLGFRCAGRSGSAVVRENVVEVGIESRFDRLTALQPLVHPIATGGLFSSRRGRLGGRFAVIADRVLLGR